MADDAMQSEWFNPCCMLHPHPELDCKQAAEKEQARLELEMVRAGHDLETHGGKRVRYVGSEDPYSDADIDVGRTGTIFSTLKHGPSCGGHVWVEWDFTEAEAKARIRKENEKVKKALREGKEYIPQLLTTEHAWDELEVLEDPEDAS